MKRKPIVLPADPADPEDFDVTDEALDRGPSHEEAVSGNTEVEAGIDNFRQNLDIFRI